LAVVALLGPLGLALFVAAWAVALAAWNAFDVDAVALTPKRRRLLIDASSKASLLASAVSVSQVRSSSSTSICRRS
jgi:hypothetical protein